MYIPPKPKYKPEPLYQSDINDLVEAEMEKGGIGSGKKGHQTAKTPYVPQGRLHVRTEYRSQRAGGAVRHVMDNHGEAPSKQRIVHTYKELHEAEKHAADHNAKATPKKE